MMATLPTAHRRQFKLTVATFVHRREQPLDKQRAREYRRREFNYPVELNEGGARRTQFEDATISIYHDRQGPQIIFL